MNSGNLCLNIHCGSLQGLDKSQDVGSLDLSQLKGKGVKLSCLSNYLSNRDLRAVYAKWTLAWFEELAGGCLVGAWWENKCVLNPPTCVGGTKVRHGHKCTCPHRGKTPFSKTHWWMLQKHMRNIHNIVLKVKNVGRKVGITFTYLVHIVTVVFSRQPLSQIPRFEVFLWNPVS